ncbi:MAG: hypothetical protein ABSG49_11575 [Methanoregula sp.]|jgi:hypothetical protein|uniref:hypothetical protein n=1 Tax=Methanoregula sp. TaxID=2052170 RepID=UPI003C2330E7
MHIDGGDSACPLEDFRGKSSAHHTSPSGWYVARPPPRFAMMRVLPSRELSLYKECSSGGAGLMRWRLIMEFYRGEIMVINRKRIRTPKSLEILINDTIGKKIDWNRDQNRRRKIIRNYLNTGPEWIKELKII